jgi:3-oxoacyl-[acyl-carrier protein] reductase
VNSVAIVTGASQGIGRSTAVRLARDFSAVVLAARNADALQEVANAVKSAGPVGVVRAKRDHRCLGPQLREFA